MGKKSETELVESRNRESHEKKMDLLKKKNVSRSIEEYFHLNKKDKKLGEGYQTR